MISLDKSQWSALLTVQLCTLSPEPQFMPEWLSKSDLVSAATTLPQKLLEMEIFWFHPRQWIWNFGVEAWAAMCVLINKLARWTSSCLRDIFDLIFIFLVALDSCKYTFNFFGLSESQCGFGSAEGKYF